MSGHRPGYHVREIKRGALGKSSKIREELEELEDAEAQGAKLMALIELADMLGAIEQYLLNNFDGITMQDLLKMSEITQRAFINGHRKGRP